ncbi:hypothetical protein FMM05_12750 [Flavobacterium zepuense]|uniref:Lipoprotein n=1 Tax=Flavobacterium zepuense TaxID=2593302 RepID=A0A552UZ70_9FLAO|nr:hypothetical protein [Flavobacterium zepuense]TRW23524.1 hypothetical protein FMM05_12750 [Flavobacterium zepuense]
MKLVNVILLFLSVSCFAQVKTTPLTKATLPQSITYQGKIINAVKFKDSHGKTIVVTTETGEYPSKAEDDESYRDAELFAYCYVLVDGSWKQQWKMYDFSKECPVDLEANFVKNTFALTDLDKNGTAEVWLMYNTGCHGDPSPIAMKVILYEGTKKYAMRGTTKVRVSETKYEGGEYTFDEPFKQAPKVFEEYAIKLWNKNISIGYNN